MHSRIQVSPASRAPPGIKSPAQQTRDTLSRNRMLIRISKIGAVLRATLTICTPGPEGHMEDPFSTFLPTLGFSLHPEGPIAQAWGHPDHHIQAPRRPKQLPVGHPPGPGVHATARSTLRGTDPEERRRPKGSGGSEEEACSQGVRTWPSKAHSRTLAVQELWGVGWGWGRKRMPFVDYKINGPLSLGPGMG